MLGISNTTTTAEATLVLTYTRNRLEQGCSRGMAARVGLRGVFWVEGSRFWARDVGTLCSARAFLLVAHWHVPEF